MTNHVWVIEMLLNGKWEPCSDCTLKRNFGRYLLKGWKANNPADKFRLRKYVAKEEQK